MLPGRNWSSISICAFVIAGLSLISLSCNFLTEPKPYVNGAAHSIPPDTGTAVLSNYFMNQVVTGTIDPIFDPGLDHSVIDSMRFYIDSAYIVTLVKPPYDIQIDTRTWSNGSHSLLYGVYQKGRYTESAGILLLSPPPAHVYKTTLVFDDSSLVLSGRPRWAVDNVGDAVIFEEDHDFPYIQLESFSTLSGLRTQSNLIVANSIMAQSTTLDGKRLVILDRDPYGNHDIEFINLAALESDNTGVFFSPDTVYGFAVGEGDVLYFSDGQGRLNIMYSYGGQPASYSLFDGPARFLSMSPDSSEMIAVDNRGAKIFSFKRPGGNAIVPHLLAQSQITDRLGVCRVDWTNKRIFVTRQNTILEAWDMDSFSPVMSYQLPGGMPAVTNIAALMANSQYLCAAYAVRGGGIDSSIVAEYNISSGVLIRSWKYSNVVRSLLGSDNGRYMFACTSSDQWIVDLGGTP